MFIKTAKFIFSKDCTFYTAGVQDLATEPIIVVDNENIKIDEIKWPEYTIKTEQIYTGTISYSFDRELDMLFLTGTAFYFSGTIEDLLEKYNIIYDN